MNPEAAIPGLNPILPVVTSVSSAVPTTTNTDEGEGIVKLENEEAWTEDSIPRDSYEAGLNKNYEQVSWLWKQIFYTSNKCSEE